jgi:hypothetical protein
MNVSPPDLEIRGRRLYISVIGRKLGGTVSELKPYSAPFPDPFPDTGKGFYERGCQVKTLLLLEEGFVLLGIQPPAD